MIKLENATKWDGKDRNGRLVDAGLYIFQYVTATKRRSGTVTLVRWLADWLIEKIKTNEPISQFWSVENACICNKRQDKALGIGECGIWLYISLFMFDAC